MTKPHPSPAVRTDAPPPTAVIACAVLEAEILHLAGGCPHLRRIEFLEQGLHNTPVLLQRRLQEAVTRAEEEAGVERIALAYGLCSRGIEGVQARHARLVVPRAHDCITLLLGDRHRYDREMASHPGTYWYSPGWIRCHPAPGPGRADAIVAQYRDQFGEEAARYLAEADREGLRAYTRAAYVDFGWTDASADLAFARHCAAWLGWSFARLSGDAALLAGLLSGPWPDDRFLTVPPGATFRLAADDRVVIAVPATEGAAPGTGVDG